jgi:hypothetical protein
MSAKSLVYKDGLETSIKPGMCRYLAVATQPEFRIMRKEEVS